MRPEGRPQLRAELAWAAGAALLTCVLAVIVLKLWDADLGVPFRYDDDSNQNQLLIKSVLDHGWYENNPDLGAPFGQKLYDFPVVSGDNLQMVLIKGLGVFTGDSAAVMNLFFLLTFPLTTLLTFACGRGLGLSRPASSAVAVLYALLPYHFIRGELHLFIAAYYAVPLGVWLAVTATTGGGVVPWQLRGRRLAVLLVACLVIGSAHVYYAAFVIALIACAALTRLLLADRGQALAALAVAGLIGLVVVANHLPNAIYRAQHGQNVALERTADDTENYGLKLAAMFLPVTDHRVGPLKRLRDRYNERAGTQLYEGPPQALGFVPTLGIIGLLLSLLVAPIGTRRRPPPLVVALAVLALVAILIGTVGGLSSIFSFVVTPQLRAWGRISVVIALLGLLAVGYALDALGTRRGARAGLLAIAAVVVLGVLDQTTPSSTPAYAEVKAQYESDDALVGQLEATVGQNAAVFELPYEPYPEPQPVWIPAMGPYDMGRGYLHSTALRWSYGLMKGRGGDWQWAVVQLPPALIARAVAAVGFSAIYIDRGGYADRAAAVIEALEREVGARPTISRNGRLAFFDLRGYRKSIAANPAARDLRARVLRPVEVEYGAGFSGARHDAQARYHLAGTSSNILLANPAQQSRRMTFRARLVPAYPAPARVRITLPGGKRREVRLPVTGATFEQSLDVPRGTSAITIEVDARDQVLFPQVTRPYDLRVENPLLVDDAFTPFGAVPDERPATYLTPFGRI